MKYHARRTLARRTNIGIFGDTGVGKSTLVNAVLGADLAPTGMGAPVTQGFHYYFNGLTNTGVWDSDGFEHGTPVAPVDALRRRVHSHFKKQDGHAMNVAWYCWDASGGRVTQGHRELIKVLTKAGLPVIGVVTKVHSDGSGILGEHARFIEWLNAQDLGLAVPRVFPVSLVADPDFGVTVHGLGALMYATPRAAHSIGALTRR